MVSLIKEINSKIVKNTHIAFIENIFLSTERLNLEEVEIFCAFCNSSVQVHNCINYEGRGENCITIVVIFKDRGYSMLFFLSKHIKYYVSKLARHDEQILMLTEAQQAIKAKYEQDLERITGFSKIKTRELDFPIDLKDFRFHKKVTYLEALFGDPRIEVRGIE